jgi:hypothetical protein
MRSNAQRVEHSGDRLIRVANDFSRYPGGRYKKDGANSGEAFRDDILVPALMGAKADGTRVVVILDGTSGYPSSFLEEAFGGLIRVHGFDQESLNRILVIDAEDPVYEPYEGLSRRYIQEAQSSLRH